MNKLTFNLHGLSWGNSFEIALSRGSDAEPLPFARPVVLEISIEDEYPIILSADGADTVDIVFNSTGEQAYQFDELTSPCSIERLCLENRPQGWGRDNQTKRR